MLIGVMSKDRNDGMLLANFLCARYDAVKIPLTAAASGVVFPVMGAAAWKPHLSPDCEWWVRHVECAMREWNNSVWIELWKTMALSHERVVIPDVRSANEVEEIKKRNGVVIGIDVPTPEGVNKYASEHIPIELANIVITVSDPYNERQTLFKRAAQFLDDLGYETSDLPPRIYIPFDPAASSDDVDVITGKLLDAGFDPVCPTSVTYRTGWCNLLRYKSLADATAMVVEKDLEGLAEAHGVLAYLKAPSISVAMEILIASLLQKPVAIVVPHSMLHHPWLWAFGTVFWEDVSTAIDWLQSMLTIT